MAVSEIYFVLLYRTQEAHMANKELNRLKVLLVEMGVLTNSLLSSGERQNSYFKMVRKYLSARLEIPHQNQNDTTFRGWVNELLQNEDLTSN